MAVSNHVALEQFMAGVDRRNPAQPEFVQAVREIAERGGLADAVVIARAPAPESETTSD